MNTDIQETIRENCRALQTTESRVNRQDTVDAVRLGLGSCVDEIAEQESIGVKDVLGLAGRIKRRRSADQHDLVRLGRAFQQDDANITAFTNTPGALSVLVKELTGNDLDLAILACECLCNLALGSEVACNKVVLAAGSYLLTFIDSSSTPRLQITTLWTITNLLASGSTEAAHILISQKIVTKLATMLSNRSISLDIVKEAQTALNVLVIKHSELLRKESKNMKLFETLIQSLSYSHTSSWLNYSIIYYACQAFEYQIDQSERLELLHAIVSSLGSEISKSQVNQESEGTVKMCVFALRTITNLIVEDPISMDEWKRMLAAEPTLVHRILGLDDVLARDVMWLVAETGLEHFGTLRVPSSVRAGVFV